MILLADNEGPDQTARMRRLIWAVAVRKCPKNAFSHGAVIYLTDINNLHDTQDYSNNRNHRGEFAFSNSNLIVKRKT